MIVSDNVGGFRVDTKIGGGGVDPNPPTFQTEADAKRWIAEQKAEIAKSLTGNAIGTDSAAGVESLTRAFRG